MDAVLAIISAGLTILTIILRYRLSAEKTKGEKLAELAASVEKKSQDLARKIADGKVYDVVQEMDSLVRSNRMLRLLAEGPDTSKGRSNP